MTHDGRVQVEELETPIGVIGIAATSRGLAQVTFPGTPLPVASADDTDDDSDASDAAGKHLAEAKAQLTAYFDGTGRDFTLTIDWSGVGGLRLAVLDALHRTVGFGATTTYGALAVEAGSSDAARAVGGIMGSNPVPIVVGCHRVLAADGLGGFGGGLRTKEWLLAWEGSLTTTLDLGLDP
ncbi:MAG TPA: methylated-DNA--[protein]-cysteine S-methyltransferase [Mycobacteriales bacterium]|nr:methylated-DNA--[protein]-cysteine S-methyltransferase [Mycobacteriales bacterium]